MNGSQALAREENSGLKKAGLKTRRTLIVGRADAMTIKSGRHGA